MFKKTENWIAALVLLIVVSPAIFVGANYRPDLPDMSGVPTVGPGQAYMVQVVDGDRRQIFDVDLKEDLYGFPDRNAGFGRGVTYFWITSGLNVEWGINDGGSEYILTPLQYGWYRIEVTKLAENPGVFFFISHQD